MKKSDVFIENFVPGKLSELGFGFEQLKEINPKLICASISGFGSHGPYHQKPGYDVTASAFGGLLSITGPKVDISNLFLLYKRNYTKYKFRCL